MSPGLEITLVLGVTIPRMPTRNGPTVTIAVFEVPSIARPSSSSTLLVMIGKLASQMRSCSTSLPKSHSWLPSTM